MGSEKVEWVRHYSKNHKQVYQNEKNTYLCEFRLVKFDLGIRPGHYSFPFSFLLSSSLPSSFRRDHNNYIHYDLSAVLLKYDDYSDDQVFKRQLHIR
jgi:hypothetical protein